jgi:hypothetical protein
MSYRLIGKLALLLSIGAGLVAAASFAICSFRVRWEAERCLNAAMRLHVGLSKLNDARKIMEPFRQFETDRAAMIDGRSCQYFTYRLENRGPHLLGLHRPTQFAASLVFCGQNLVERDASFIDQGSLIVGTKETIIGFRKTTYPAESPSGMFVGVYDPPSRMDVFLDTRASESDRESAYAYNLGCFTAILSCQSVHQVLPRVK